MSRCAFFTLILIIYFDFFISQTINVKIWMWIKLFLLKRSLFHLIFVVSTLFQILNCIFYICFSSIVLGFLFSDENFRSHSAVTRNLREISKIPKFEKMVSYYGVDQIKILALMYDHIYVTQRGHKLHWMQNILYSWLPSWLSENLVQRCIVMADLTPSASHQSAISQIDQDWWKTWTDLFSINKTTKKHFCCMRLKIWTIRKSCFD